MLRPVAEFARIRGKSFRPTPEFLRIRLHFTRAQLQNSRCGFVLLAVFVRQILAARVRSLLVVCFVLAGAAAFLAGCGRVVTESEPERDPKHSEVPPSRIERIDRSLARTARILL